MSCLLGRYNCWALVIGLTCSTFAVGAEAVDQTFRGRSTLVRQSRIAKFSSRDAFVIPAPGSADDPTMSGATLEMFDVVVGGAGNVTFSLDASGWRGLGSPAGSRGYRYSGSKDTVNPSAACRTVFLRDDRISAICRGASVTLSPPFNGNQGIILSTGGTRYCAEFGGKILRNDSRGFRRKNAFAQLTCPVQGTPTPTHTPTVAPTSTPTPGNPPAFIGTHQCDLDSLNSALLLQLESTGVLLRPEGEIEVGCGAVDGSGQAVCTCELLSMNAIPLLGIGDVCVESSGPCDSGVTECLGGSGFDFDSVGDHNIGTCGSQGGCASQCDAHCGGLGTAYSAQGSSCEGFCQGGANEDLVCGEDAECPGGHCPGKEPSQAGPHDGVCNCTCLGEGLGGAVPAGSMTCEMGVSITVEIDGNQICGDLAPSIVLQPACGSLTTATATATLFHANDDNNDRIGPLTAAGQHQSCEVLATGNTSGMALVGHLQFYDSALGDLIIEERLVCQ